MNRILIVDSDPVIRFLYEEELTEDGYEVISSGDCTAIMETIAEKKPDLIVLEARIGEFSGLDILQHIRNRYYDMPVILCSNIPDFKFDPRSIAADYFLVKSFDLSELKLKINMAIDGCSHLRHEMTSARLRKTDPTQVI